MLDSGRTDYEKELERNEAEILAADDLDNHFKLKLSILSNDPECNSPSKLSFKKDKLM